MHSGASARAIMGYEKPGRDGRHVPRQETVPRGTIQDIGGVGRRREEAWDASRRQMVSERDQV
jgi:hypothetical protein